MQATRMRVWTLAVALLTLGTAGGCVTATDIFNADFLAAVSGQQSVATVPGAAPAILVTFENRTSRVMEMTVTYRTSESNVESSVNTIVAQGQLAEAIPCPITEITVGEVTDLSEPGVYIALGGGTVNDPFLAVEPFGRLLKEGDDYQCGDAITFALIESNETASGYRIIAIIERDG